MDYRSGVTGDPHRGVDIFPDLFPRAKPYCGVKCCKRLHFPATDCGAWGDGSGPGSVVRLFRVSHCLDWTKANKGWLDVS